MMTRLTKAEREQAKLGLKLYFQGMNQESKDVKGIKANIQTLAAMINAQCAIMGEGDTSAQQIRLHLTTKAIPQESVARVYKKLFHFPFKLTMVRGKVVATTDHIVSSPIVPLNFEKADI